MIIRVSFVEKDRRGLYDEVIVASKKLTIYRNNNAKSKKYQTISCADVILRNKICNRKAYLPLGKSVTRWTEQTLRSFENVKFSTYSRGRYERGKNRVSFILFERTALDVDASNDGDVNQVSRNRLGTSIEEFRSNCTILYATGELDRVLLILRGSLAMDAADLTTFEAESILQIVEIIHPRVLPL